MIKGFRLGDTEGFYLIWDGKDTGSLKMLTGPYLDDVREEDGCARLRGHQAEMYGTTYAPVGSVIAMKDTDAEGGALLPPFVVLPEIEWAVKMFTES